MNDYAGWVHKAIEFTKGLTSLNKPLGEVTAKAIAGPPLPQEELEQLKGEVQKPLPIELCHFWLEGSRCCSGRYIIERSVASYENDDTLYGGVSFFDAAELPNHIESCLGWAEVMEDAPNQREFWQNSIPFAALDNGDYLGIFSTDDEAKCPVVYLCHDGECSILAPSFSSFLHTWERLCYIGPEIWMLEEYLDIDGVLNADTKQADELRDLFDDNKPLPVLETVDNLAPAMLQERRTSFMKQICTSAVMFVMDENDKLPDADNWQEQLQAYDPKIKRICKLPGNPASVCTMNNELGGVQQSTIIHPEKTVLFFESRLEGDNPSGTQTDVFNDKQRDEQIVFVLADSRVEILDQDAQRELKWTIR